VTKRDKATVIQALGFLAKGETLLFNALKAIVTGDASGISVEESDAWYSEAKLLHDRLLEWYEEESE
jgi:hypothetical protein